MQVHIYRYIDVNNEITLQILEKEYIFFLIRKTEGLSKCLKCTAAFEGFLVVFSIFLLCTIWFKFPTDVIVIWRALQFNCTLLKICGLSSLLTILTFTCKHDSFSRD